MTNPASHVSLLTIDAGLGVVLEHKDANQIPTTMKYDRFGRLREVNHADGSFERYTFGLQQRTTRIPNGTGGTLQAERVEWDALGRVTKTIRPTFKPIAGASTTTVETNYDRLGRVASISRPFAETATPVRPNTRFGYDDRDRVLSSNEPDGATITHRDVGLRDAYVRCEGHGKLHRRAD